MYIKIMDICNMIITLLVSLHMTSLHHSGPILPSPANARYHYTAGLAEAVRVKFLAQGNNNKQNCLGIKPGPPGSHRLIPNHQAAPKLVICLSTISQPSNE